MPTFLWLKFVFVSVFRNLWRAPRRTALILSTIAVAVCGLILFSSFIDGVKGTFRRNIISSGVGMFQIVKKGYLESKAEEPYAYPIEETKTLEDLLQKEMGNLTLFTARQELSGLLSHGDRTISASGRGVEAKKERERFSIFEVVKGKHLADSEKNGIFLGRGLAEQLDLGPGDVVTLLVTTESGSLNAADMEVAGIFRSGIREIDNYVFYMHLELASKLIRVSGPSSILLMFDTEDELLIQPKLKELIETKFPHLRSVHWRYFMGEYFDNSIRWLEHIFFVFQLIILVIAVLGIVNIFMINLYERIGEIATLRAIGTQRFEIIGMVVLESLLQSFVGALIGVLIGAILMYGLLPNGIMMPPPPGMTGEFHVMLRFQWLGVLSSVLLTILIAGGSGIYPAVHISRTNIVKALGRNV